LAVVALSSLPLLAPAAIAELGQRPLFTETPWLARVVLCVLTVAPDAEDLLFE
jgi:hypothetical protein